MFNFVTFFFKTASNSVCFRRAKSARVITFEQFNQALTELAPKRFKGKSKEEAVQQLYGLIVGKEPANAGVTVSIRSQPQQLHSYCHQLCYIQGLQVTF